MLGFFGTALFGLIAAGAWMNDERKEISSRSHSRSIDCDYYFDKNGKMRWTKNGKKLTPEEVHNVLFNEDKERRKKDYYKKEYWGVKDLLNGDLDNFTVELFLTKYEAEKYRDKIINEIKEKCNNNHNSHESILMEIRIPHITIGTYTQYGIDLNKNTISYHVKFHKNFEED